MFKDNICGEKSILIIMKLFKIFMQLCRIIVPIIVIISLCIAFYNIVINPSDEAKKKLFNQIRNGLIGLIVVFLLPVALNYLFSELRPEDYYLSACWDESDTEVSLLYESSVNEPYAIEYKINNQNNQNNVGEAGDENFIPTINESKVLPVAERIWKQVVNGNFTYNAENTEQIPITGNYIDCSSYVSWVLYELGYKDFAGNQHRTKNFMATDWRSKYGWTEIPVAAGEDIVNKLKPGDIVVRTNVSSSGKVGYGHISIVAVIEDGNVYSYDCGDESLWRNSTGGPQNMTWFMKDSRPGKIIRIS